MSTVEHFRRALFSDLTHFRNELVCVVGRIESVSQDKVIVDTQNGRVTALIRNINTGELREGECVELFGRVINPDMIQLNNFVVLSSRFNLEHYNTALRCYIQEDGRE
jgi:hypothetical protein